MASNIVAAPRKDFKLGMKVKVIASPESDGTFPRKYVGRRGTIIKFDNTECGATPKDPMVIVKFDKPVHLKKYGDPKQVKQRGYQHYTSEKIVEKDGFWSEELEIVE